MTWSLGGAIALLVLVAPAAFAIGDLRLPEALAVSIKTVRQQGRSRSGNPRPRTLQRGARMRMFR